MKLIRELSEDVSVQTVLNEETQEKQFFIEGIFMQSEVTNRNGRIYPKPLMESEVNRYNNDFVIKHRAVGELDHPTGPKINSDRVSHIITELKWEGNNVMGKAKVLDTPTGKIVKEFLKEGITLGVSSRGVGSVMESAKGNHVNKFRLATVDIVTDPSGPDCFVNGIMENVEWIFDESNGWVAQELAESIQKEVKKGKVLSESQKMKLFEEFLKSITTK